MPLKHDEQSNMANGKREVLTTGFENMQLVLFLILFFGIMIVVGFVIVLYHWVSWLPNYVSHGPLLLVFSYFAPLVDGTFTLTYLFGFCFWLIGSLGSLVCGIVLLLIRKPAVMSDGLPIVTGVIALVGGLVIVSAVLSVLLLLKARLKTKK